MVVTRVTGQTGTGNPWRTQNSFALLENLTAVPTKKKTTKKRRPTPTPTPAAVATTWFTHSTRRTTAAYQIPVKKQKLTKKGRRRRNQAKKAQPTPAFPALYATTTRTVAASATRRQTARTQSARSQRTRVSRVQTQPKPTVVTKGAWVQKAARTHQTTTKTVKKVVTQASRQQAQRQQTQRQDGHQSSSDQSNMSIASPSDISVQDHLLDLSYELGLPTQQLNAQPLARGLGTQRSEPAVPELRFSNTIAQDADDEDAGYVEPQQPQLPKLELEHLIWELGFDARAFARANAHDDNFFGYVPDFQTPEYNATSDAANADAEEEKTVEESLPAPALARGLSFELGEQTQATPVQQAAPVVQVQKTSPVAETQPVIAQEEEETLPAQEEEEEESFDDDDETKKESAQETKKESAEKESAQETEKEESVVVRTASQEFTTVVRNKRRAQRKVLAAQPRIPEQVSEETPKAGGGWATISRKKGASVVKVATAVLTPYQKACAKPQWLPSTHRICLSYTLWNYFVGRNQMHVKRIAALANEKVSTNYDVEAYQKGRGSTIAVALNITESRKPRKGGSRTFGSGAEKQFRQVVVTMMAWRLELLKWQGDNRQSYDSHTEGTFRELVRRKDAEQSKRHTKSAARRLTRNMSFVERRLLNELRELEKRAHEFPNIAVCIPEDNLQEWHVNLRAPDGPMKGKVAHIKVSFPDNYPTAAPEIKPVSNLNGHPNIYGSAAGHRGRYSYGSSTSYNDQWLCLDMIKSYTSAKQYEGWTPCYTMSSLLMQLQTFLFAENVPQERTARTGRQYGEKMKKNRLDAKSYDSNQKGITCTCGFDHDKGVAIPLFQQPLVNKSAYQLQCIPAAGHKITVANRAVAAERAEAVPLKHPDMLVWKTVLSFLEGPDLIHSADAFIELARCAERWNMTAQLTQKCYYTQEDSRETVLGVGFKLTKTDGNYTENIVSDGNVISVDAWTTHKHRIGAYGEGYSGEYNFTNFLPLALNQPHFKRAIPYLDAVLADVSSSRSLNSHKKLDTLCDLMLKSLVNLMTSFGRDQCEAAVVDFCRLHHLLLSYCREAPRMRNLAITRINRFLVPGGANKSITPNMGHIMMYRTVVDIAEIGGDAQKMTTCLMKEGMLRGFKWADAAVLKKNPSMSDLVEKYYISRMTSRRIMLFQSAFVNHMCAGSWEETLSQYDATSGEASQAQITGLFKNLQDIVCNDKGWSDYFSHLGLAHLCPGDEKAMAQLIYRQRERSEKILYHSSSASAGSFNKSLETKAHTAKAERKVDDSGPQFKTVYDHAGMVEDDHHVPKINANWDGKYIRSGWHNGVPIWEKADNRRLKCYTYDAFTFSFMVEGGRMLTQYEQSNAPIYGSAEGKKSSFF